MRQGTGHREQGTGVAPLGAEAASAAHGAPPALRNPRPGAQGGRAAGFTLIELIIVVAIIGILATIAVPAMRTAPQRAREAALKEDLFTIRSAIDQFHADRGRWPASLDEVVSMGYIRQMPVDPVTRSSSTWVPDYADITQEEDERTQDANQQMMIDVHSGSDEVALDGTRYSDW